MLRSTSVLRLRSDVTLGGLTSECAPRMLAWMQAPEVAEAIGLSQTPTMERTLTWIDAVKKNENIFAWAVFLKGAHVGNVAFDQIDKKAQTARMSVYIGEPDARSKGVGTTAMYRALEQAFYKEHLFKVWLSVHVENIAAIKVYTKIGFQLEGTLRAAFVLCDRRVDALYMGLLATEFLQIRVEQ